MANRAVLEAPAGSEAGKNDDLQGQCTRKVPVMAARQSGLVGEVLGLPTWPCPRAAGGEKFAPEAMHRGLDQVASQGCTVLN